MTNYGRNFGFRIPPRHGNRSGKNYVAAATVIGAPVKATLGAETSLGLMPFTLAVGTQAIPLPGLGGICVYEYAPNAYAGLDPELHLYSDLSFGVTPAASAIQVVSGKDVKVWLKNTTAHTFLGQRSYAGRIMVQGFGGATSVIAVGDYLTPGLGSDSAGYWGETTNAANAWLVVTKVDATRGEVEARLNF
jgi:hypothetical protein